MTYFRCFVWKIYLPSNISELLVFDFVFICDALLSFCHCQVWNLTDLQLLTNLVYTKSVNTLPPPSSPPKKKKKEKKKNIKIWTIRLCVCTTICVYYNLIYVFYNLCVLQSVCTTTHCLHSKFSPMPFISSWYIRRPIRGRKPRLINFAPSPTWTFPSAASLSYSSPLEFSSEVVIFSVVKST